MRAQRFYERMREIKRTEFENKKVKKLLLNRTFAIRPPNSVE
jgi:hypothetical protein